ncbi:MAG: PqqD family protein [Dehalococcoidia bacterium]
MTADARYEVNKPDVVDESVDGEVLIVHLGTGAYYSSRGAGDVAWRLLSAGKTVAEASASHGIAEDALSRFVDQLIAEELVRPRTTAPQEVESLAAAAGEPTLDKYTDMQELLLLDPIHDVEEAGWPMAKPAAEG